MSETFSAGSGAAHPLLQEEQRALRAFLELLKREEAVLIDGNVDALQSLASEKSASFANLDAIGRRRHQLMAQAGPAKGAAAVAAWLDTQPEPAAMHRAWSDLMSLARQVREFNRSNGKLITNRLLHTQQALTVLLTASNDGTLYGPDGHPHASAGRRSLISV